MSKYLFHIVLGLVLLSGCKRRVVEPSNSEAVFYIRGDIDGYKININAGDDGYYMLPFYQDDTLGIREFMGRLGKYKCVGEANCPHSIQVSFREKEKVSGVRDEVDKSVFPRVCDIRGPARYLFKSYKASFLSKTFPAGLEHQWFFGDGNTSSELNPVHYYLNETDSVITPVLVVKDAMGGQSTISYEIAFERNCDVDFFPQIVISQITLNPQPTIGRSELWSYNGGTYMPFTSIGPPVDSITTVCLQSTENATGCIARKCKNVVLDTAAVCCVANFDVVKEVVTTKDVKDYLEVTLLWQNESGRIYRSDTHFQPPESYFEIVDVSDYKDEPNGNATKKVTIRFVLRLFGTSENDFVTIRSDKSVIAIAYPKN